MKTNIFKVKEKREKKIVIEEEKLTKIPFLFPIILFLKRNKKFLAMSSIMLALSLILVSIGIAFSLFRGTNDYEITYITGSEEIGTNNDPEIDDEEIEEELLGEIAREDGVVILVESFVNSNGDVIYYYTDGTSVMVTSKGKIYRISTDEKGNYGVNRNGKVDKTAKKVLVTSTTSSLSDGSIVTSYSDGTAMLELGNEVIFVRDSNNIELDDGKVFDKVKPSGVALSKQTTRLNNTGLVYSFSDGTTLVTAGGEMFLVNKNVVPTITNGNIKYNRNNIFSVISEKKYADGNTIRHFSNGSATITDEDGKVIYVRSSGDLVLKKKKLYEIIPNDKANSRGTIKGTNGTNVVYFDNGSAIIISPNNDRKYVEDADSIIYDGNKNITSSVESSKLIEVMVTEDGKKAYSFENGKTQVINSNNSSYIVDTDTLVLRPIEDDKVEEDDKDEEVEDEEKDESDEGTTEVPVDPSEGIYITEAEHEYDDPLDVQSTTFIIKNDSTTNKVLRIVIEEVSDYAKYNISRLEPNFVKFQSTVGDDYVPASHLTDNTWIDDTGVTNYVIYDGVIKAKTTVTVAISLYVDYSLLDNSHQNKAFIGTIKVYADA